MAKASKTKVSINFPPSWNQGGTGTAPKRKLAVRGRPRAYASALELEDEIEKYFEWCEDNKRMPTTVGVCLFLNITRETWYQYAKPEHDYSDTIKSADLQIEECWAQNLKNGQAGGSIFYLKNKFGYRDVVENPGGGTTVNFILPPEIAGKYALGTQQQETINGNADVTPVTPPPVTPDIPATDGQGA